MTQAQTSPTGMYSARPALIEDAAARTGLTEPVLVDLVHGFCGKIRVGPVLGPNFAERIADRSPLLARMVDLWSSVALMTGRYRGAPVPKHVKLPVSGEHFERWLALFRETAAEVCPPEGAAHVIGRAERIARSLDMARRNPRQQRGTVPNLRSFRIVGWSFGRISFAKGSRAS